MTQNCPRGHASAGTDRPAAGCLAVLRQVPGRPSAVAELVHVLLIAAAVIVAVGAAGPVSLLTWR